MIVATDGAAGAGECGPSERASRGEQSTSSADPGAEVALWVALALWLVHCSLILSRALAVNDGGFRQDNWSESEL